MCGIPQNSSFDKKKLRPNLRKIFAKVKKCLFTRTTAGKENGTVRTHHHPSLAIQDETTKTETVITEIASTRAVTTADERAKQEKETPEIAEIDGVQVLRPENRSKSRLPLEMAPMTRPPPLVPSLSFILTDSRCGSKDFGQSGQPCHYSAYYSDKLWSDCSPSSTSTGSSRNYGCPSLHSSTCATPAIFWPIRSSPASPFHWCRSQKGRTWSTG